MKKTWLLAWLGLLLFETAEAENHHWLKLLHYVESPFYDAKSEVDSEGFFLSREGKYSPEREKEATQRLISEKGCTFPARSLLLNPDFQYLHCPQVREWLESFGSVEITLIYAGPFVENPASVFGHTFLRFDRNDRKIPAPLLEKTVSFAAQTGGQRGLALAAKGLVGAYQGKFFFSQFDQALRKYRDIDRRELWEFRLRFTSREVLFILLHLFELKDQYFDYYFIDENCSYHLLSLLEASGQEFKSGLHHYVTPVQTIRKIIAKGQVSWIKKRDSVTDIVQDSQTDPSTRDWLLARIAEDEFAERKARENLSQSLSPAQPAEWGAVHPSRIRLLFGTEDGSAASFLSYRLVYSDALDRNALKDGELQVLRIDTSWSESRFLVDKLTLASVASLPRFDEYLYLPSWSLELGGYRPGENSAFFAQTSAYGGLSRGPLSILGGAKLSSEFNASLALRGLFRLAVSDSFRIRIQADGGRFVVESSSNWFDINAGMSFHASENWEIYTSLVRQYEQGSGRTQVQAGLGYSF